MRTPEQKESRKVWDAENIEKVRQSRRDYNDRKREIVNARNRAHYHKNPLKHKNSQLRRAFGISLDGYNYLFQAQGGRCAICGTHQSELPRALAVDHDHITNTVRGLLCSSCNVGIGHFRDDPQLLQSAIDYLGGQNGR